MATAPFSIQEFVNASGTVSYRVTGSFGGERIRKNFSDSGKASAFCNEKNAAALRASEQTVQRAVVTTLSPADLATAEAAVARGPWQLPEIIDAGIASLSGRHAHADRPVAELVERFLAEVRVGDAWLADLRKILRTFVLANPGLALGKMDAARIRSWLADGAISQQTRRNRRSAISRFCSWLINEGLLHANPASGIRIQTAVHTRPPPPVLTALQSDALLRSMASPAREHGLGHVVLCLLCGLRPSEADRLTWTEINLDRAELTVLGRKRGSRPRIVPLQPAALAWLIRVQQASPDRPGKFLRKTIAHGLRETSQPFAWHADILRHTYASMRAAVKVPIHELAAEMGNSPRVIYAHYRAAISPGEAEKFWALRPA